MIDIPWLHRHGYLKGLVSGGIEWRNALGENIGSIGLQVYTDDASPPRGRLRLHYTRTNTVTGEEKQIDYTVDLVSTPCNFGGFRYWFLCPLVIDNQPCQRRVAKLCLPPGQTYFGCRHCYGLTYQCQREHSSTIDRLIRNPRLLGSYLRGVGGA
jgi:hypothetical protein